MIKPYYVEVSEEINTEKTNWFIEFGNPNANDDFSFEVENEGKAFAVRKKIAEYLEIVYQKGKIDGKFELTNFALNK